MLRQELAECVGIVDQLKCFAFKLIAYPKRYSQSRSECLRRFLLRCRRRRFHEHYFGSRLWYRRSGNLRDKLNITKKRAAHLFFSKFRGHAVSRW
ncbi:Uncharacterized conserved protein [Pseudomonas syringae pv. actinidiae]|uniref:Uncharacterized conserved protein n=1 Tax=Pseudomonas syringae pv. actinidiae TaxID=103796 RepID=A0A2V0Q7M2_PSESF|nr:Uncharacterized conserved protein [Pseudomonas syringae pv. actinidiae]